MKKLVYSMINLILIISLIVPFSAHVSAAVDNGQNHQDIQGSSGIFRTTVFLQQPYDLTRLEKLDVIVIAQDGMTVDLLVTELQLEALSRLGFEPALTEDIGLLVEENQDTSPWLQIALREKISQASVLVNENRKTNETTTEVNDLAVLDLIKSFSIEQLVGIQALPGVDNDADGLTDTQESWWCTDPNNPDSDSDGRFDGEEIQAIKDWMANRRAVAPGETPWASWPFDPVTCPDKDFDSIPNLAERWELGLNMDLESTDRDKFDDGQEVFGVTYCPGGDYSCGYGDLPRSSDAGYVGQVMPSWVKAPGNHPFVAAFPMPVAQLVESSLNIETVTEITTDYVISNGTQVTYSTSHLDGTNTSTSETETWNKWEEVSRYGYHNPKINTLTGLGFILSTISGWAITATLDDIKEGTEEYWSGESINSNNSYNPAIDSIDLQDGQEINDLYKDNLDLSLNQYCVQGLPNCFSGEGFLVDGKSDDPILDLSKYPNYMNGYTTQEKWNIGSDGLLTTTQDNVVQFGTGQTIINNISTSPKIKKIKTKGSSEGGAFTTTTGSYSEDTITNGNVLSDEESWGTATAINSAHAADLWFSYTIKNTGMDYAREISNLAFNIYLNQNPNPISTYFVAQDLGGDGTFHNFMPGESHVFTTQHIPLTLEQLKLIDLGGTIRIVLEDLSFASDELFYENAVSGNVYLAIEDGVEDNDELLDKYLIPSYPDEMITDVLRRFFPSQTDSEGDLIAIWTPEYIQEIPAWCQEPRVIGTGSSISVWCKHSLSTSEWWNIYTDNLGDSNQSLQESPAFPGTTALFRFNKDTDLDGFSDRSEMRFGTNPLNSSEFPKSELIAGIFSTRTGDNVVSTLSLLNTGINDVLGVEAIMIAPDESITITNNTVGGSGRVNAGKDVVVGSRIKAPEFTDLTWVGTARPVSGGYFAGVVNLVYTFTVSCANPGGCVVGQDNWSLVWSDGINSDSIAFTNTYKSPTPMSVGSNGLQISFISGNVFDGNTFTVEAFTPSDTFQYTINYEPYTQPIVVVSYNDPQSNHRFVIPPNAMNLTSPSVDLGAYSGTMKDFYGVEIVSSTTFTIGPNELDIVADNPSAKTIQDGYIFLNFVDSEGTLVSEISASSDFLPGPNFVNIDWDTSNFVPSFDPDQEYVLMAFWTDNEGNILDIYSRTLSSLGEDPTPEFAITSADETWDFGSATQGTILKREFAFANTGERTLLTYIDTPDELLVSQTGSKLVSPADIATYEITLNTSELSVGEYSNQIIIHTSDPANPTSTIVITGSITEGEASLPALVNQLPLDYAVTVPGPQSVGNWHSFTHPIGPDPQSIHPVKVYSQDYATLWGMGKYAYEFGTGTGGFNLFGDGRNGNLTVVTGETRTNINATRTNINGSAGSKTATVSSSSNFSAGDLVLIHQTQGTSNVGKWEYNFIASISGTTWTLTNNLAYTYNSSSGKAQVIKVPQYQNVTVQSGGTIATPAWNGSTGGITVFLANGTVNIAGTITSTGSGYRRGDRGEYLDPVRSQGWQGESMNVGTAQSRYRNSGGGGGGMGDDDESCGADKCMGAGGGGGGYGSAGIAGTNTQSGIYGGEGGYTHGSNNLITSALLGSGGGGGGADGDNSTRYGGYGGAGGGLIIVSGSTLTITGSVTSNGTNGLSGATGDGIRTGGGGGGSGGAVLLTGSTVTLGPSKVTALAGAGGAGINGGGNGGSGGVGRIFVQFCDTRSGSTNPGFNEIKINCHIAEQVETSPYTTTRLQMPESFTTSKTYNIKYGRRLVFSGATSQTTTLRLPAGYLESAELDILISNAGVGVLSIQVDFGADGTDEIDWSPTVNNLIEIEDKDFTAGYNQWWSTSNKQLTGTVDVPVKITLSKAAQVLLTDLKISTYASSLNHIQLQSGSYSDVRLNIKASGTVAPLTLGIDVGDDGTIDQSISVDSPSNPHDITSINLASQVNTYLSGFTGLVDVPIRLFFYNASQAEITNFSASIIGDKDIGLSVSDITLPISEPMETDVVPVSAMFHNNGNLPSGNFTAGFYASTPDVGEWYIGSALLPSILPGQSTTAEISWNTSGFVGQTSVKVVADPFDHILETTEENNQAITGIYIRTRPDLSVTTIAPSDSEPKVGEVIELTVTEKNLGETDAMLSTLALFDGNPDEGGSLIGEASAELIGGSETLFSFDWQPSTTGWHRLYVKPDITDVVNEFDEGNNLTWFDIYVGLAGPLLLDSGTSSDPVYTIENGYGYIDIGLPDQISTCGEGNLSEETLRRDPDGTIVYQFDHLLPGHFYHLDITLYECDGAGRQQYVYIDDNQFAGPEDLGDGQVHRLSLRLDPAFYSDRSVIVSIKADGIDGAVVSEVNLFDIDYRYADAGGSADPAYPGNDGYGWIDGDAITNWGLLPYQSVRVDQADSELRYRFDDLDPDKRYSVHFTFWQPDQTGRIQQVKVDGIDSGLTVNTGDYLKHQEKIILPESAYSTDGSVVVSIIRTNASVGAMVNEIALEEETISTHYGCSVNPTPYFSETFGSVLIADMNAPIGSVIEALSPRGETVGCFTVTSEGNYGFMRIYGEDTSENPVIPGMRQGEMVEYRVNGAPSIASPLFYWQDDHNSHRVDLNAGNISSQSILLTPGWNLISINVEPPTPLISSVLASINERYTRVLGESGIYIPTLPDQFNTLREMHFSNGYYVRINGTTSVSLLVEGIAQDCATPKQLHAGWNWIGAPCTITPTATALQSIDGFYQRVLGLEKTYNPELPEFSTLLELKPGEGYLIFINEDVVLTYPSGMLNSEYQSTPEDQICVEVAPTPYSTIIYGTVTFGDIPAPMGTIIEFITPRNEIAGCGRIGENGTLPFTQVYGAYDDDIGFVGDEPIMIRLRGGGSTQTLEVMWSDDKYQHNVDINLGFNNYYLPIIKKDN